MMTVGAALVLGPAAARARGGGGGGGAHGGMGTGTGLGAGGGMNGGMTGGFDAPAHGPDMGSPNGSAGGALGQTDDERGVEARGVVHSEGAEPHETATAHPGSATADTESDKPMATGSARTDALQLASTMHSINQTAFDERRQLLKSVNMRLKSSRTELHAIQANARNLRADARAKFQTDLEQVKTSSAQLKAAMKATKDSDDGTWTARREALGHAYQHYADAVARLEVDAADSN